MKNMKYQCDEGGLLEDPILYRMLFGSLIYLTITRLDISYVVHIVSKLMQAPQHSFSLLSTLSFNTSLAHLVVAYSSILVLHSNYKPTMMLIGQATRTQGNPLPYGVCFLKIQEAGLCI
jgi:hypothetical protein